MKTRLVLIVIFSMSMLQLRSQSFGDCISAFEIEDPKEYCSGEGEFDSEDIGDSGEVEPPCWSGSNNDMWFTFVAIAKSVNIVVDGEVGTMKNPEIMLYRGNSCGSLLDINSCEMNTAPVVDITSLNNFNLEVGSRYFIRVDGRSNGDDGSFQLCVSNYNPPASAGQDCNTASLLCNKDPLTVLNVTGEGFVENEADGSCLDVGPNGSENRSVWYKWTCSVSGTFTFDLIPISPRDDYDFGIFELPDGINSCTKDMIRCGATNGGDGMTCGPNTGLDLTSTDTDEDGGCESDEDGYLQFIQMEAGMSYAMLINNFSSSELGFNLTFGGTAEFEGPQADFEITVDENNACNPGIIVTDMSIPGISGISEINWEFGVDATPSTATGPGPISVGYTDFGDKVINLQVISDEGCIVYQDTVITLDQCSYIDVLSLDVLDLQNIACDENNTGRLELMPSVNCSNYEFSMDNGAFQNDAIFENLSVGPLTVTLRDENGCTIDSTYTIVQAADFTVDAGADVTIEDLMTGVQLDALTTATGDVTISWSPSTGVTCADGSTNCLNPQIVVQEETTFTLTVTDESGCLSTDEVVVSVNLCGNSEVRINVDSLRSVTCAGDATGYLEISGKEGVPEYMYSFDDGPFTSVSIFDSLPVGLFFVQVRDAQGCTFGAVFEITAVPDFTLDAGADITLDLPGDSYDPMSSTTATGNFTASWSPSQGVNCPDGGVSCLQPTLTPTETTTYTLTILDENGCLRMDELTVFVPDLCANSDLGIQVDSVRNIYCNGAFGSYLQVSGENGFGDYLFSFNGGPFEQDSVFTDLNVGEYNIGIQDRFNCTQTIQVTIGEDPGFQADAGADLEIDGTEPLMSLTGSHDSGNEVSFSWSPGTGIICPDSMTLNCSNPLVNPQVTTTYTMMVTDALGCVATDEVTVRVVENRNFYAPNIFSPNDDGINDLFSLLADPDIVEVIESLTIFDRWGNKVFDSRNLSPADSSEGWNGLVNSSPAEQGVYTWYATLKFFSDQDGEAETVSGDVTLVR